MTDPTYLVICHLEGGRRVEYELFALTEDSAQLRAMRLCQREYPMDKCADVSVHELHPEPFVCGPGEQDEPTAPDESEPSPIPSPAASSGASPSQRKRMKKLRKHVDSVLKGEQP